MQATAVVPESARGLPGGGVVGALERPARGGGGEVGVANRIARSRRNHLHIIHEAFSSPLQEKLERIADAVPVIHDAGPFHRAPVRFGGLAAVGPTGGTTMIAVPVDQFQAAPAAVRPPAPPATLPISQFVHGDVDGVGDVESTVCRNNFVRLGQRQPLPAPRQ